MAPTESITAIVLRRTKLGETDVIVTLLAEDGSQYRAVAKGARKPTSSFASRLEVFSLATILLAKGKNLDIVKEARLIEGNVSLRDDFFRSSAASPVVELLAKATFQEQKTLRLFALTKAALLALATTNNNPLSITVAALLKELAFLGFRPAFIECVDCGNSIDPSRHRTCAFSYFDGGVLCSSCATYHETTLFGSDTLAWCDYLLYSTFDDIERAGLSGQIIRSVLTLIREWIRIHLGFDLRSINFLFKNVLPLV